MKKDTNHPTHTPAATVPEASAPGSTAPAATVPEASASGSTATAATAPEASAPGSTATAATVPEASAPGPTAPAATVPEASASGPAAPAATVPEASASGPAATRLDIEERIIEMLRTVYDPEIPVNIYDLGLIYRIELSDDCTQLDVDMTLTAPNCPAADFIMEDVRQRLATIQHLTSVNINLVFEPEWDKDMMSEEAKLELGLI